jgi:hypothetical protein
LLDQELNRLPKNLRLPVILCDLEGMSIKEAVQHLGWPQGTVAGRLARGRKLLAKRLTGRGWAMSIGSLAAMLSGNAASVRVPISLETSTFKAVTLLAASKGAATGALPTTIAALMEGVLKTMLLTKFTRMAVLFVVVTLVAASAGYAIYANGREQLNEEQQRSVPSEQSVTIDPRVEKNAQPLGELDRLHAELDAIKKQLSKIENAFEQFRSENNPGKFVTRIYLVQDLGLSPIEVAALMRSIRDSIATDSWAELGGPGKIQHWPVEQSLSVSGQTADIHKQVQAFLRGVRKAKEITGSPGGSHGLLPAGTKTAK